MFYYGEEQSRLLISDGLKAESDHRQLIKELSKYKGVKYYTYLCRVAERYKQQPGSVEWLKDRFDFEQKQVKDFERMWRIKAELEAGEPWPPYAKVATEQVAPADGVSTQDPAVSAAEVTDPELNATDPELNAIAEKELANPNFALSSPGRWLRVIAGNILECMTSGQTTFVDFAALRLTMESCEVEIQNYMEWEREAVIEPCMTWVRSLLNASHVEEVSGFGSRRYFLGLPATDFDVVFITVPGANWKDMLHKLASP